MELKSNVTLIDASLAPTDSKITFCLTHSEAGLKHWRKPLLASLIGFCLDEIEKGLRAV